MDNSLYGHQQILYNLMCLLVKENRQTNVLLLHKYYEMLSINHTSPAEMQTVRQTVTVESDFEV